MSDKRIPPGVSLLGALQLLLWGWRCPHYKLGPWPGEEAGSDFRCLRCGRHPSSWATDDDDLEDFMSEGARKVSK